MLAYASQWPHEEVCGLVLDSGRVWLGRNRAADPSFNFELDAADWAAASQLGAVVGIWHSHPQGGAEPSLIDRAMCERTALAWHVVSAPDGDYRLIEPSGWRAPLLGRPYCYGLFDCWELVRDWQQRENGVQLPRLADAPDGWWYERDLVPALCEQAGLVRVAGDLRAGDVVLMRLDPESVGADHAAVYVGDGDILHQLRDRLSEKTRYGGYWQRATISVLRAK